MRQESCDAHVRQTKGCVDCNARARLYTKRRRVLLQRGMRLSAPTELTRQRLRELRALGYPKAHLAKLTGISQTSIYFLTATDRRGFVTLATFHAVEKAWLELRHYPAVGADPRAARRAAERGWQPADPPVVEENVIDKVTVERLMRGQHTPATRDEMTEAWRRLTEAGMSDKESARRLGVSDRTLQRWRKKIPSNQRRTA